MTIRENVPLSTLTTLKVGGPARFIAECENENDVRLALDLAKEKNLSWRVLGAGSNVLARDAGYDGVILHLNIGGGSFSGEGEGTNAPPRAGGVWGTLVRGGGGRGVWGALKRSGASGGLPAPRPCRTSAPMAPNSETHSFSLMFTMRQWVGGNV